MKSKVKTGHFATTKLKRLVQADEDIGTITSESSAVLGAALEAFLDNLCAKSIKMATDKKAIVFAPHYLKECIEKEDTFDFLRDVVADVETPQPQKLDNKRKANGLSYVLALTAC
eukprot:TRINITY_DN12384_c0_g1_i1.p1 TRINITY_DN12384_c0_g1~~TRINITY_DN12384_c0_g1_i1.p1  ORF type:complete len:115 (-),score=5.75 TRINITY_DN12384_c0_g1_i1:101-445(-)